MGKTIIQEIQPQCDTLYLKIKDEKNRQHKSNQEIADNTGVPFSNVKNFFAGNATNPCVFNVSAVCIYLGISLDKLMGIQTESPCDEANARIKELELKNHDLEIHLDYAKKDREHLEQVLSIRAKVITALLGICVLMTFLTIIAIVFDRSIPNQGFYQADATHPVGTLIIIAVVVSIASIVVVGYRFFTKRIQRNDIDE